MLTNSESDSLKSVKATKETGSKQTNEGESSSKVSSKSDNDKDGEGKNLMRKNHFSRIVISRKTEPRIKPRTRSKDDYVVNRGRYEDRRGYRGRGAGPRKDRDDIGYNNRSRYHDSLDHSSNPPLPEDSRISTILRRLAREDDENKFVNLGKNLQDALALPDNAAYIRRSLDMILESLYDLFRTGVTVNCKVLAAKCIGHVGYNLERDFKKYLDWIFNRYSSENKESHKIFLMKSLFELVYLDRTNPKLEDYAQHLITSIRSVMERTDVGDIFIVTAELTLAIMGRYPSTFNAEFFHDIIDIIVGWHIDVSQPREVLKCATNCLKRMTPYWIIDMGFTINLLHQFLEDAETFKDDLLGYLRQPETEAAKTTDMVRKITAFIEVYTSVFKGVGPKMSPEKTPNVSYAFLIESLAKVMEIVLQTLEPELYNELIIAGNKCATMILSFLKTEALSVSDPVHIYIYSLMERCDSLSRGSVLSLIRLIVKVLDVLSETTTIKLIDTILQPSSIILSMRHGVLQNDVLLIYQTLLQQKEINCLIQSYEHIMADMEAALRSIKPDLVPFIPVENNLHAATVYSEQDAEHILFFIFQALAPLVVSDDPETLISFKPSIFHVFAQEIPQVLTPLKYPMLHYSYIFLLKSHCAANDYFIISNGLVNCSSGRLNLADILSVRTTNGYETSPTTNYLITVINLLIKNLVEDMDEGNKILVIKWAVDLLLLGKRYHTMLRETNEVIELVKAVCTAAMDNRKNVSLCAIECLKKLVISYHGLWPQSVMKIFMELSVYYLNSINTETKMACHQFMDLLPCLVTTFSINGSAAEPTCALRVLLIKQYEEMCGGDTGELTVYHFKKFVSYLLGGIGESNLEWMIEMVVRCSPVLELDYENGSAVIGNQAALSEWAAFEAVRLCVDNKLRTCLGRPLETFTAFENMIRDLGKESISRTVCSKSPVSGARARLLVQFIEQLEKSMYNAAEGTALAFPPSTKPVSTFFSTNRNSCCEWMSRIRFALMVVCIHCGLASAAVRHGYAFLQTLLDNASVQSVEFESTLINVGRALANMGEKEAVEGLYAWAKEKANVKNEVLIPLMDQAGRRYEAAIAGYKHQLKENLTVTVEEKQNGETDKRPKTTLHSMRAFVADQITECYLALNSWEELAEWKEKEPSFLGNENGSSSQRYKFIHPEDVKSIHLFDEGDFIAAQELLSWKCPSKASADSRPSWDYCNILNEMNFSLMNIGITMTDKEPSALDPCCLDTIKKYKAVAETIMEDCVRDAPSEVLHKATLMKYIARSLELKQNLIDSPIYGCEYKIWKSNIRSPVMEQALWWCLTLDTIQNKISKSQSMQLFTLEVAKVARKEGNYKFADKTLKEHLHLLGLRDKKCDKSLIDLTNSYMETWGNGEKKWTIENTNALRELTNLLISTGTKEKGIELGSFTALGLSGKNSVDYRYISASMLRKLSSWICEVPPSTYINSYLQELLELEAAREIPSFIADLSCCPITPNGAISVEDSLVGRLLRLSILTYPSMCKSWERLASWSYTCALNCLSRIHEGLPPEDITAVRANLPSGIDHAKVFSIMTTNNVRKDSEDIEGDAMSGEAVEKQLKELGSLNEEQIEKLLAVWRKVHLQVYNHFRLSAYAYFKYIEISEYHEENNKIVTATLRLLRLIVKHAAEVQGVVEAGLSGSPNSPWTAIVPQLFSRLNHPEPYVRKRVSELLSRIGLDSPHLIIFPAVVGSHTGASTIKDMPTTKLFRVSKKFDHECEDGDDEEEEEDENDEDDEANDDDLKNSNERAACLENSFLGILDTLSKKYGEQIAQVKMLVSELRRITLLWDELWLGALNQHQADISRRFMQLQAEVKLTDSNSHLPQGVRDHLVAEKHRLILKPLLFVLEQLHAITSVTPETPHERKFQEKFGKEIEEVLKRLREPSNPRVPSESWNALKSLQTKLQQSSIVVSSRSAPPLSMTEISPPLATLKNSVIAMPGLKNPVTIQTIENNVAVLPTKTKPKKLVFNGSDGRQYTYLFKGLEDLHLDERIMQLLSIANSMLREERLKARHYSVIPLGPRSGLISWVENVTPIFTLYKKWQHREATSNDQGIVSIMRPSELFYSKLGPILKEVGIQSIDPLQRNKWPLSALKKCLLELMQSTPNYLLSKELWCHSVNSSDWWQITKLYSSSLAVMSMIGYIIGLGDRHLDNVLVNLKTGEVVHIDYNVCFEKGKTLRVPEKVPFRLTPNLRAALGVTGVEGVYRLTCEHVLRVLKSGQETLLTLLEAFVYDPLIDWTPLNEGGYTGAVYGGGRELASETKQSKKDLEREVTCCMFKVRMVEVQQQWLENKKILLKELEELLKMIEGWQKEKVKLKTIQQNLQERHSQLSLLKETEGQPNHSLFTLGFRYSKHIQVLTAKQAVTTALQARIQECDDQISNFQAVMVALKSPDMAKWIREVGMRPKEDVCQVFDLIKEFLQNAGQNQMVQQCVQSEREVGELCCQQTQMTSALLDMLRQYWEICRQYPASSLASHRSSLYKKWCQELLEDMSPTKCQQLIEQIRQSVATTDETMREAAMFSAGLHRHYGEAEAALRRASERAKSLPPHPGYDLETTRLDSQAVEAVILTALCALNKRFLMMESAATSAGDCLLNLTSREGDWFLEDMVLMASTALNLVPLIPSLSQEGLDSNISTAIKCLQASFAQYSALQEVDTNFTNIILVEAMQGLQCEEPSVLNMVERLESVVTGVAQPLSELSNQLHRHLRFIIMGMESPHETCLATVMTLQSEFVKLLEPADQLQLTQGEMLLMGFDGLFTNVNRGRDTLLQSLSSLQSPPAWRIIDQIREAKTYYTAPICIDKTKDVLEAMFFVKRLDTITEVLRMVASDARGFRAEPGAPPVPHDPESLSKPVRRYIADYISYQLLGIFSLSMATTICLLLQANGLDVTGAVEQKDIGAQSRVPLEDLCKKMVEQLSRSSVREASGLVSQREAAWRQGHLKSRLERELVSAEGALYRAQWRLTAHHWLHEHILVSSPQPPINRSAFMHELRKVAGGLQVLQPKLKEAFDQQNTLIASAEQRLKWAAGANPALSEVMSAFESCVRLQRERVDKERNLAQQIISMANTVLFNEALRIPTQEAILGDNTMIRLVEDCEKAYMLIQNTTVVLTSPEEGLVSLLPPKKRIDSEWIAKAEEKISESIVALKSELEPMQMRLTGSEDCVKNRATIIRSVLAKHHRIIADIKTLLKSMIKYEDAGLSGLEEYLTKHKHYTEKLGSLTKSLSSNNCPIDSTAIADIANEIKAIASKTDGIYSELLQFSVSDCPIRRPQGSRLQEDPLNKQKRGPPGSQERNAYAMSVWRRVKYKLEGRDPDPNIRSTEKQQVDWTIMEATNVDNLALLYEGWTPWV